MFAEIKRHGKHRAGCYRTDHIPAIKHRHRVANITELGLTAIKPRGRGTRDRDGMDTILIQSANIGIEHTADLATIDNNSRRAGRAPGRRHDRATRTVGDRATVDYNRRGVAACVSIGLDAAQTVPEDAAVHVDRTILELDEIAARTAADGQPGEVERTSRSGRDRATSRLVRANAERRTHNAVRALDPSRALERHSRTHADRVVDRTNDRVVVVDRDVIGDAERGGDRAVCEYCHRIAINRSRERGREGLVLCGSNLRNIGSRRKHSACANDTTERMRD